MGAIADIISTGLSMITNGLGVGIKYYEQQEKDRKQQIEDMAKVIEDGGKAITEVACQIAQGVDLQPIIKMLEDKRDDKAGKQEQ